MKRHAMLGLAAAIGLTLAAASVESADAGQRHRHHGYNHGRLVGVPDPMPRRPLAAASVSVLGWTWGHWVQGPYWAPAPYGYGNPIFPRAYARAYGWDDHVAWCSARYRSYDPHTDMFKGYDGDWHYCVPR